MKKFEKIFIGILLILSIASIGIIKLQSGDEKNFIVIKINNKIEKKIDFDDKVENIYDFTFGNNTGYLEVKNGKVRMLEMDRAICPKAICSNTGWIQSTYQSIVCLPNKITVTIEGSSNDQEIDFVI